MLVFNLLLLPLLMSGAVQGGERQTLQVTERTRIIQPATTQMQGNDPDNEVQPALGYNVLDSSGKPINITFTGEY